MACVGLISLIRTLELQFLEQRPFLVDVAYQYEIQCLRQRLSVLLTLLEESEKDLSVSEANKFVFALVKLISFSAEEEIESQVIEILTNGASHVRLHQILKCLAKATEILIWCSQKYLQQRNQEHITPGGASNLQQDDAIMVGHAEELERTKEMLLQHSTKERQVVSIVGMGGIGKTTMTKKIYDDPLIRSHFDLLGWATMSQHYDLPRILQDLCRSVVQMTDEEMSELESNGDLADKLRRSLMGRRYLLVVDDIWGSGGWDDLQRCFPDDFNGSRILLTTRLKEVADYIGCSGNYVCNLPFLNLQESWQLFSQKLGSIELCPEVEKICRDILGKCGGLPLAITVAAGLLSKTRKSLKNWNRIASAMNDPKTSNLHDQCSTILTLSFKNLPYHLKVCFLYFGVSLKVRREIPTKDLLNLWIAEGFVREESGRSLEECAMNYLNDLIDRNLVLISTVSFTGNVKTCKLHDLLLDLCLREVEKEELVSIFKGRIEPSMRDCYLYFVLYYIVTNGDKVFYSFLFIFLIFLFVRSGSCGLNMHSANRWLTFRTEFCVSKFSDNYSFHKSRTLLFFGGDYKYYLKMLQPVRWRQNVSFKMIRVLDLKTIYFDRAPTVDISDLILLRGTCQCEEIGSKWLQGLWKSQNLRFIEYPYPFPIDNDEIPVHDVLHTLYWVSYLQCTEEFFLKVPNVKVLGIRCNAETWWDYLHYLTKLEKLIVEDVHSEPTNCEYTAQLGSINSFPQSLKKLIIVNTQLSWEAITVISMLPNLESLKLLQAQKMGEVWETRDCGFSKLKFLFISVTKLKVWKTRSEHFPVLQRLALHNCFKLEKIPEGFAEIITLQLIELQNCYPSLVRSAKAILQEAQSSYGNDQLVVREYYPGVNIWVRSPVQ